jgi:hypothetical protein
MKTQKELVFDIHCTLLSKNLWLDIVFRKQHLNSRQNVVPTGQSVSEEKINIIMFNQSGIGIVSGGHIVSSMGTKYVFL